MWWDRRHPLPPSPSCLRILGGNLCSRPRHFDSVFPTAFILFSVFSACFGMCLFPVHHSNPFAAKSPDWHVWDLTKGWVHETMHTRCNWISYTSVLKSLWSFLPLSRCILLGRRIQSSLSPNFKVCSFSLTRYAPNPNKSLFFPYAEQFCSLCLIPSSSKLCPKNFFHIQNGTSGFCISLEAVL